MSFSIIYFSLKIGLITIAVLVLFSFVPLGLWISALFNAVFIGLITLLVIRVIVKPQRSRWE